MQIVPQPAEFGKFLQLFHQPDNGCFPLLGNFRRSFGLQPGGNFGEIRLEDGTENQPFHSATARALVAIRRNRAALPGLNPPANASSTHAWCVLLRAASSMAKLISSRAKASWLMLRWF